MASSPPRLALLGAQCGGRDHGRSWLFLRHQRTWHGGESRGRWESTITWWAGTRWSECSHETGVRGALGESLLAWAERKGSSGAMEAGVFGSASDPRGATPWREGREWAGHWTSHLDLVICYRERRRCRKLRRWLAGACCRRRLDRRASGRAVALDRSWREPGRQECERSQHEVGMGR